MQDLWSKSVDGPLPGQWGKQPKASNKRIRTQLSSDSSEWYTPPAILARVEEFFGRIDLDPCPPSGGAVKRNGLAMPWHGRVFVNPPYGGALRPWIIKALTEPVDELIMLLPARTETAWFAPCYDHTICFITGRLRFRAPQNYHDATHGAPFGSVLVYRGERVAQFARCFGDMGPVMSKVQHHDG